MAEQLKTSEKVTLKGMRPSAIIEIVQDTLRKNDKVKSPLILAGILEIEHQVKEARGTGIPQDSPAAKYFEQVGHNPLVQAALLDREKRTRGENSRAENKRLREILGYPPRREISRRTLLGTGAAAIGLLLVTSDRQASSRAALVANSSSLADEPTYPTEHTVNNPIDSQPTTSATPTAAESKSTPTVTPAKPNETPTTQPVISTEPTLAPSPTASPDTAPITPTRRVIELPEPEPTRQREVKLPPKEERIFRPAELSYDEVRPWIPKLRNTHDAVLTESLFTTELGGMNPEFRGKVLDAVAQAHAQALFEHYGDTDAIIGLDPGHGGTDIGSSDNGVVEQTITYQVANMVADKLFELSKGKYRIIILRPERPNDQDLDGDKTISYVERIQKRKAQLVKMEAELRKDKPEDIGKNIAYVSIHFNGGNPGDHGAEVYYPNEIQMDNEAYRTGSEKLAKGIQENILNLVRDLGYNLRDRKAKMDPDRILPGSNADTSTGGYLALGSRKLDRDLQRVV